MRTETEHQALPNIFERLVGLQMSLSIVKRKMTYRKKMYFIIANQLQLSCVHVCTGYSIAAYYWPIDFNYTIIYTYPNASLGYIDTFGYLCSICAFIPSPLQAFG